MVKKFLLIVFFLALFLVGFFSVKAYKESQNIFLLKTEDYKIGGKTVKVKIEGRDSEKGKTLSLKAEGSNEKIVLSGFEDNVDFCQDKIFDLDPKKATVCLVGYVGVHSQNLQLINFDGEKFFPVKFATKEGETDSLISDVPNIIYSEEKLMLDMRNYDLDPVQDVIRQSFIFRDNQFIFDSEKDIQYH